MTLGAFPTRPRVELRSGWHSHTIPHRPHQRRPEARDCQDRLTPIHQSGMALAARSPTSSGHSTCLGDELVVIGQVGSAVDTAVRSVAVWQISLESFGLGHLHHLCGALPAQLQAGAQCAAALRASLTEAALEDARKSRGGSGGVWHCPHCWDQRKTSRPASKSGQTVRYGE